ncbi:MAG: hypothetical protein SOY60_06725 [Fusobacterium gastrosuis]|uniref:hypothetical protein n=1 Tax=Fusobacterium gastrosuis TaxID=1755100 RepID=UPI002A8FB985|nr:hypothetical protein [Fusobacterium gastrosuis]
MKLWHMILLIMIVIRVVAFTFLYFNCLKDCYKKNLKHFSVHDSKYYTMHEWLLIITLIIFFTEIILFLYFIALIGEIAININQSIHDFSDNLAHKICKKIKR